MKLHLSLPVLEQTRIKLRPEKPGLQLEFAHKGETKTPWPEDIECKHYQGRKEYTKNGIEKYLFASSKEGYIKLKL